MSSDMPWEALDKSVVIETGSLNLSPVPSLNNTSNWKTQRNAR